jgi:hypothetical protein
MPVPNVSKHSRPNLPKQMFIVGSQPRDLQKRIVYGVDRVESPLSQVARARGWQSPRGGLMKTGVDWKPQGHSAKRWQGVTPHKDPRTLRQTRPPKKRESSQAPVWKGV